MASQLEIPILNPLKFVAVNPIQPARYFTKFSDDYLFEDTIYDWQENVHRYQPWQIGDVIPLQLTSNFEPLLIEIQDPYGNTNLGQNFTKKRANKYAPGSALYETSLVTTDLKAGLYRAILTPAGNLTYQQKSEWFYLCPDNYRTVLVEYFNVRFHGDVVFETGIKFAFRFPGFFDDKEPGSMDVLYADQELDQVQLSSRPYTAKTLYLGHGNGVPFWMAEKMNWAFSCSNVSLDGKLFAKADGAKWTSFVQEGSAVKGYAIDVRQGINRASRIVNPQIDITKKITLVYNIDQSVFGSMAPTGGTIVTPIISTE